MIRLYLEDWATNTGILGFYRILEHAKTDLFEVEETYIDFDPKLLQDFPEWFFNYAFDMFSVTNEKENKINTYLTYATSNFKRFKDFIFADIKGTENKLSKRLPIEGGTLKELFNRKKDVSTIEELKTITKGYLKLLKQEQVNEVLTLNMIRFRLGELHGQTSFLQRSRSTLNRSEHEEFLAKDFVQPILLEQEVLAVLQSSNSPNEEIEDLNKMIQQSNDEDIKKLGKQTITKLKKDELLYCPVIEGQFALTDYTEAVFLPNAVSLANATNYTWNNQKTFPISNLYRLIMFCSVFGLYKDGETYSFIQTDEDFDALAEVNDLFVTNKKQNNPFEVFLYDTLKEAKDKAKWISKNMLIVEFQNSGKKTTLTQNFLSEHAIQYLQERGGREIDHIKYPQFRNVILRKLLNGEHFFRDITIQLRKNVDNNYSSYDTYAATLAMFHLNRIKECYGMSNETREAQYESMQKRIHYALMDGREVRRRLTERRMENKIPGITYRLLNALTTNNRQQFFETLFRTFLLVEKNTSMYVDATREHSSEFEGIASALLSGLNDKPYKKEGEETN
ncbi:MULTISPECIES: type I-B CRISPR-associated protein Cas8b1/Cst1 [Bacillus cereus group]|uniref:type I-B CRISPR-associated protein Cas8b1/Cst1 n=1 Tax=Bacillus cereus group TaxID=86661 RepID=UPI000BF6B2A3|nr:type I-B CRISPR-associated protein Cas8b1/Cst1 [Bacillus cereus]MDA2213384.1 type I-B CRISPR-associated protein Cas8b1/Cst1 [Bacillus cereus]MDA2224432.1 type I-B CRISPR-associated protein Cas8b1/Cst1 [Bacillus cereus]MDA2285855.1 type I-B CRISPR-associated protein Cas8b1/Cst1 [Bacillus cereus]MDA2297082.1 type I-B CRISPR-associated protein Cas8b1/Cst1 [Bacillus cereus]PFR75357.1 type I-B CRISPR-associated protein Cas8b1/Cst1 [Bacillus cereus]